MKNDATVTLKIEIAYRKSNGMEYEKSYFKDVRYQHCYGFDPWGYMGEHPSAWKEPKNAEITWRRVSIINGYMD